MARQPEFPCVFHPQFGAGLVLGERAIDAGLVRDVWFVGSEQVRPVLPEYLAQAAKPEFGPGALRSAWSTYKKAHRIKKMEPETSEPRPKSDECEWRRTFEFAGAEDALADAAD